MGSERLHLKKKTSVVRDKSWPGLVRITAKGAPRKGEEWETEDRRTTRKREIFPRFGSGPPFELLQRQKARWLD
jgi:hypothetical protein